MSYPQHQHPTRPARVPPLPHPSWRHSDNEARGQLIDAREFWQRLGL